MIALSDKYPASGAPTEFTQDGEGIYTGRGRRRELTHVPYTERDEEGSDDRCV